MNAALRDALSRDGATFGEGQRRPAHFGDPAAELGHALERCAVADRSDSGRTVADGPGESAVPVGLRKLGPEEERLGERAVYFTTQPWQRSTQPVNTLVGREQR